jgi:hypothetical protein
MKYDVYYAKKMVGFHLKAPFLVVLEQTHKKVAGEVEASDLDDLFRKMNVVNGTELPLQLKVRSMCSGDVAVDEKGIAHFCAMIGWAEVNVL